MKTKLFALMLVILTVSMFSCEKKKCYVCETRSEVGTTLETSVTTEICDESPMLYEKSHSSVTLKSINGGPVYYSQTITECKEKK